MSAPTASDIVFAGASKVSAPRKSIMSAPTASDIVFAGASKVSAPRKSIMSAPTASDIVFAGASKVSNPRKSLVGAPTASNVVFVGASKVSGPRKSLVGPPTASDIVFAGASKILGPQKSLASAPKDSDIVLLGASKAFGQQNNHVDFPITSNSEFVDSSTEINLSQSNHPETQLEEDDRQLELAAGKEENEAIDYQSQIWDENEICGLFDLFDTDSDGYLTTDDLVAFTYMWEVQSGVKRRPEDNRRKEDIGHGGTHDIIQKAGQYGRIDFPNFLKFVQLMDIDLDSPIYVQQAFLSLVRSRLLGGFVLGSALRKLVIRFYINFTVKEDNEITSRELIKCKEGLVSIFNAFDLDGDGCLLTKEVKTFMRIWETEPDEVHKITHEVDAVWNGKVDFGNFLDLLQPTDIDHIRRTHSLRFVPLLNRIFSLLDEDDDGYLTTEDVKIFKRIWTTNPDIVENDTNEIYIAENEKFDFPDLFNLFPLRIKSFYLEDLKEDGPKVNKLKYIFSLLDEDDDGYLSAMEVKTFTRIWSMMPTEALYIMEKVEVSGNRIFDFPNFLNLLPIFKINTFEIPRQTPVQHELITQLNRVFNLLDKDCDGRLTTKQVEGFMSIWRLPSDLVQNIIARVDDDSNGRIDFPFFLELLYSYDVMLKGPRHNGEHAVSNLIEIFRFLDEDTDGCLTTKEVESLTLKYMLNLDPNDASDVIAKVNTHEKGMVDFPTLLNLLYPKSNELQFNISRLNHRSLISKVIYLFDVLPKDRGNLITTKEVETFTRIWKLSPTITQYIMNKIHADGNGTFTLPQFYHILCWPRIGYEDRIEEYFRFIDEFWNIFDFFRFDGRLTLAEMKTIWRMWRPNSPQNEIEDISIMFYRGHNNINFLDRFLELLYSTDITTDEVFDRWDEFMKSKVRDNPDDDASEGDETEGDDDT